MAAAPILTLMDLTSTPSRGTRSEERAAQTGLPAETELCPDSNLDSHANAGAADSRLNDSTLHVGQVKTETARGARHTDLQEPPPEWSSVRLEPQVTQLLETMDDAVIAHDCGVIIGFNHRVPELLSCPADKILWRRLSKFIDPISLPTLTRWIQASDRYTILVNGILSGGRALLLRLEAVASLLYPGGRRVEIVTLTEFANGLSSPSPGVR